MKTAERVTMLILLILLTGSGAWLYHTVSSERVAVREAVARGEYQTTTPTASSTYVSDDWRVLYPGTVSLTIGESTVEASVADSLSERLRGLSDTPFLPPQVVKLFVFGVDGPQSIWMKDMKYPLDIIWLNKTGKIVHIEEGVSPDTYPQAFSSPAPARYVIEANVGFVASSSIAVGVMVDVSVVE